MLTHKDVLKLKNKIANGLIRGADLPIEYQRLLTDIKYKDMDINVYSPIILNNARIMGLITHKCNLTPVGKFFNEQPFKQYRSTKVS